MIILSKYDVIKKIKLSKNDFIILFSPYPEEDIKDPKAWGKEIWGKEIFRVKNDEICWQISIPNIIENELFWRDGSGQLFDDDGYVGISMENKQYGFGEQKNIITAYSFQGCIFSVCVETGEATYIKWTRD